MASRSPVLVAPMGSTAYCVVKGDEEEIGRTPAVAVGHAIDGTTVVSWENPGTTHFAIPLSWKHGGGLPRNVLVELWTKHESNTPSTSGNDPAEGEALDPSLVRLVGIAEIGADGLLSSPPSRFSRPLIPPGYPTESRYCRRSLENSGGIKPGDETREMAEAGHPRVVLRITPHAGLGWAERVRKQARQASPTGNTRSSTRREHVSVVYTANSEGSAKASRDLVTPEQDALREAYEDASEIMCASIPACCPRLPAFAIAPFSDVGLQYNGRWIGPSVEVRHAIAVHRATRSSPVMSGAADGPDRASPPLEDEFFMRNVAAEAEGFLRKVRAKGLHREQLRLALTKAQDACQRWLRERDKVLDVRTLRHSGVLSLDRTDVDLAMTEGGRKGTVDDDKTQTRGRAYADLFRAFLGALGLALPGVSLYIGLVENQGRSIRYVACNQGSSMAGRVLKFGEGVSFACVGPRFAPYATYPGCREPMSACAGAIAAVQGGHSDLQDSARPFGEGVRRGKMSRACCDQTGSPNETRGNGQSRERSVGDAADAEAGKEGTGLPRVELPTKSTSLRNIADLVPDDAAIRLQSLIRRKFDRLSSIRQVQMAPDPDEDSHGARRDVARSRLGSSTSPIPKLFDYERRVGWPFVCVPLVGSLGASSIGVLGMDTFEQIGDPRVSAGPGASVFETVRDAARDLGYTVCVDRRRRALDAVVRSCFDFEARVVDILHTAAKALTHAIIVSTGAEVWRIYTSDQTIFLLTEDESSEVINTRDQRHVSESVSRRELKVAVISAEVHGAVSAHERSTGGPHVKSISIGVSTRESGAEIQGRAACRTPFVPVDRLREHTDAFQSRQGEQILHIGRGVDCLLFEVWAGISGSSLPEAEHVIAKASLDLSRVSSNSCQRFNLFAPDRDRNIGWSGDDGGGEMGENGEGSSDDGDHCRIQGKEQTAVSSRQILGRLVMRLIWDDREDTDSVYGSPGCVDLIVHGASGISMGPRSLPSLTLCVVRWGEFEVGRTRSCANAAEPDWEGKQFRLFLPRYVSEHAPSLRLEVWVETVADVRSNNEFLGQVILNGEALGSPSPGVRSLPLFGGPSSKYPLVRQKQQPHGVINFTLEAPTCVASAEDHMGSTPEVVIRREPRLASDVGVEQWGAQAPQVTSYREITHGGTSAAGEVARVLGRRTSSEDPATAAEVTGECEKEEPAGAPPTPDDLGEADSGRGDWEGFRWAESDEEGAGSPSTVDKDSDAADDGLESLETVQWDAELLIRVIGARGLREGQSDELHPYCLMRAGERELFRTRPLRFGHDMTWERPEERFRLPLGGLWQGSQTACGADATRGMSAAADGGASCLGGPAKRSPLVCSELFRRGGAKDGTRGDKGKEDTDIGTTDGTEGGAIDRYPCSMPLTLEVWGEVSGNHREFFGSATLSPRDIEHPPGDLWLPLEGTMRMDNRDNGTHGAGEGGEGGTGVGAVVRSESGGAAVSDGERCVEGLLRTVRRVRRGGRRKQSIAWVPGPATGSVHLWLGRARRSSPRGLDPGEGGVVVQVHGVTGLRQVRGAYDASLVREASLKGDSVPSLTCTITWNGEKAGAAKTRHGMLGPQWDPGSKTLALRLPRDRSLCELDIDVWEVEGVSEHGMERVLSGQGLSLRARTPSLTDSDDMLLVRWFYVAHVCGDSDHLGRVRVPAAALLHPEGLDVPTKVPFLESKEPELRKSDGRKITAVDGDSADARGGASDSGTDSLDSTLVSSARESDVTDEPAPSASESDADHAGAEGQSSQSSADACVMGRGVGGTLTVSLERVSDERMNRSLGKQPNVEERDNFKLLKVGFAGDISGSEPDERLEDIQVIRMPMQVGDRDRKLGDGEPERSPTGSMDEERTSAGTSSGSDSTSPMSAVIPEVVAKQVVNLARRGERQALLASQGQDRDARDRLIVFLEPSSAEEEGRNRDENGRQNARSWDHLASKYALVVPSAPGEVSKENIAVATEVVGAASAAVALVRRRKRRCSLLEGCTQAVEDRCRESTNNRPEELCVQVVDALKVACTGAGEEVDRTPRDVPCIVSLLSRGGFDLRVVASCSWDPDRDVAGEDLRGDGHSATSEAKSRAPLPLSSGLVRRALENGDMFLVVEDSVCVANVSWASVPNKGMLARHIPSDQALKRSVEIVRSGLGCALADAFLIVPLWATGFGSLGLICFANLPYAPLREGRSEKGSNAVRDGAPDASRPPSGARCPYAVAEGMVECAKRIGLALGRAVHTTRARAALSAIMNESVRVKLQGGGEDTKLSWVSQSQDAPTGHREGR